MSLPPELRVLCFRLSSTPVSNLPSLTPTLLSYVLRCQAPLSNPAVANGKAEASPASVLVHKLKTQLSTLLNGKSTEGRFTAAVLIKAVVEVGGWEVLNGSESWVRGLLSILGKPDPVSTKEIAIVALTKIYLMTHQYQTLVREITTPTLPAFVTACLALVSPKSSNKSNIPSSLEETVFEALSMLVPRHTSIFRPFATQIHQTVRRYIAPTSSDGSLVPVSVKESARRLYVVIHQTAAKNTGSEEWSKALRGFIGETHATADQVFRAVIEDWESTAGYSNTSVDVNRELSGGGSTADALLPWTGIFAGIERLVGLLEMLAVYLNEETSASVALPIGSLMDVLNRMLSIAIPSSTRQGSTRLHPAIDREERDVLAASLPRVYFAALQIVRSMSGRLQQSFLSIAQPIFDNLVWIFPFGRHDQDFRTAAYEITVIVLMHIGQSLSRSQVGKCYDILRSCYKDLEVLDSSLVSDATSSSAKSRMHNADTFLRHIPDTAHNEIHQGTALIHWAQALLRTSLSHLPQQYVDISLRSMVERTAILSHDKDAMLLSVLNPFVGKNGKAMASILPHLTREFGEDATVEILLRPRMPLLPSATRLIPNDAVGIEEEDVDEDMLPHADVDDHVQQDIEIQDATHTKTPTPNISTGAEPLGQAHTTAPSPSAFGFGTLNASSSSGLPSAKPSLLRHSQQASMDTEMSEPAHDEINANETSREIGTGEEDESSSDDESVHLTMQLDTDSEDEDL